MSADAVTPENEKRECPDEGTCHHECKISEMCFRVEACGPLSGVFPNDTWPEEIVQAERARASDTPV